MPTNYLLPCTCGKKTTVDANQAGLTVRCACGNELAVPAMRGLATLERVEAAPAAVSDQPAAASAWGARQGLMFLGGVIVLGGALAALAIWFLLIPSPISLQENYQTHSREIINSMPAEDLIARWNAYRNGIEQEQYEMMIDAYEGVVGERRLWIMIAGGFAGFGLLLVVIGLLIPARPAPHGR